MFNSKNFVRTLKSNKHSATDSMKGGIVYQIVLEPTVSTSDDQSDESICSLQAEPTVSAKDSTDITTEFSSEFELATSPDMRPHPWSKSRYVSSSGNSSYPMNHKVYVEPLAEETITDVREISTDGSSYDTDEDIQVLKFPRCIMCSAVNENHFFQFCHSCYQIKKTFFPNKPKTRRRRYLKGSSRSRSNRTCEFSQNTLQEARAMLECNEEHFKNEANVETPINIESSCSSMANKRKISLETASPDCTEDSGFGTSNTPNWSTDLKMDDKCLACSMKDTNALFLHGKTGHRCCCYQCAKRIWFETGRCPICRSKVNNIIKILNS